MTAKYFDVIVLGRSIGALMTAALLARRDFTVLVLGQGARPASYKIGERTLQRRAFTMLAASSPAWTRMLAELAQTQTWNRLVQLASPMMQVLAPRRRLDIPPDMALFGREIDREMPEVRRVIDDLYAELARVNGSADDAFDRDAVWPPGTFWERRETGRYAAMLPYVRAEPDADLLVEFPRGHFFRNVVTTSVLFATNLASLPPPFAVARLHGAFTRGLYALNGGEDELERFLEGRIAAHGGRCMLDRRARALHMRRGSLAGVVIDGDDAPTGANFIITDLDGEGVAALSQGEGIHKRAQREWPRITSSVGRFVMSLCVRDAGLPAPLGVECFVLPADRQPSRPARVGMPVSRSSASTLAMRPVIHLQRHAGAPGESLLVAEVLVPDRSPVPMGQMREVVLSTLCSELPFLERHLRVVDSVHDGLPPWVCEDGRLHMADKWSRSGAGAASEPMVRQLDVDPPGYLGLGGEPIRGPIERTLLVGRSVLPGLGQEGQLLAAWGAARLVTRTDRRKERMRRDMWSKVEFG
ncbi:MAG: phytoene dehydrogenase [Polyangiaceae bacterium]|nr:phytoene dehydrogenase [Polyangiaceae bacterium]